MQIILLERIKKLGFMGDVVTVKPGFARNFLIPMKKALRATEQNLEKFKVLKAKLEAENLECKKEAEVVAEKLKGLSLIVLRNAGENGHLYGSVSSRDIALTLEEQGIKIAQRQITLHRPIKAVGLHAALIQLHPEVDVDIQINVAVSQEEAEAQQKGIDVIAEKKKMQQQEATEAFLAAETHEENSEDDFMHS